MSLRRVIPALVLSAAAAALLVGCTTTPSSNSGGTAGGSAGGSASGGSKADCSAFDGQSDPALKLFTTDAITTGPKQGQKYGDGTKLSITLSPEAITAGLLPQFELNNASKNGGPVGISSEIFDPSSGTDGTYSTSNKLFGKDELVGTAMVMQVFAIAD